MGHLDRMQTGPYLWQLKGLPHTTPHFFFLFLDSDYGQLSLETWTFLHDIYDGGPVFFIEGEKENEEKQDQQEQEEDVQQE